MMHFRTTSAALAAFALIAVACSSGETTDTTQPSPSSASTATTAPAADGTASPTTAPVADSGAVTSDDLPGDLPAVTGAWGTDWSRTTIAFEELRIGIFASDPRDAITPIDEPVFESIGAGAEWIGDREPGVLVETDAGARFYPLGILTQHEIVNDVFDDVPIAVTYCPLCNTAMVFDRRIDGEVHRLGVSGLLRNSDLVMWDDRTHSLWQQITGEGIVGEYAGRQLTAVPSSLVAFSEFRETFPEGEVLSRNTGFGRRYGLNPYELYSSRPRPFNFFDGELDDRYPALERVVGVTPADTDAAKAYPFSEISGSGVVNDTVGDEPVVVFWGGDTADALDRGQIADSQAVGTGVAYSPVVDGQALTFSRVDDSTFVDAETGTTWSILGKATNGALAGASLEPIIHRNEFWFAWAAFFPEAEVYTS